MAVGGHGARMTMNSVVMERTQQLDREGGVGANPVASLVADEALVHLVPILVEVVDCQPCEHVLGV